MENLVIRKEDKAITTSLIVAKTFNKRHDNILAMVNKILRNDESNHLNIKESDYIDSTGKSNKMYELDEIANSVVILLIL